ncbi:MAG: MBL fold metallo-hydrolase [Cyclobacteriaceae bacterium]|nr:MBL fold metallo-hydrolase [Cyclobacteriaceae bacterium]
MNVRIKFLGGAKTVTGSRHLLEVDNFKILIDCGLFQGLKELRLKNWEEFPLDVNSIDAILITHAHIDHTGYLPRLVRQGYAGPIYCTRPTEDLMQIMLMDSAKLQEEETAFARKKGYSKHENPQPLYNTRDVENVLPLIRSFDFMEKVSLNDQITIQFFNASHILGASMIEMVLKGNNQEKRILFSGDIGRKEDILLYPPDEFKYTDILVIESTYGDRDNPQGDHLAQLANVINRALDRGGCLLIPAFAVGRTQMLLYYMKLLSESGRIPDVPVFFDSPMAFSVTELYLKYHSYHKLDESNLHLNNGSAFDFKNLHYKRSQEDSIGINDVYTRAIIVSSSGMCTGGRIMHHLFHRLQRPNDTLLFIGYQAEGTRGRRILEGEETIKIFGLDVPVKCHIEKLEGFSAHADKTEMIEWLDNFQDSPKHVFIVHGEEKSAVNFGSYISEKYGWNVQVPGYMESYELFKGI